MAVNAALRDYLKTRRSVGIGFLKEPGPTREELDEILTIGTRVPDHGKFTPWRLVVIQGDARQLAGDRLAALRKSRDPNLDEASLDIERKQFLPAPVTIGVICSPRPNPNRPRSSSCSRPATSASTSATPPLRWVFAASWTNRWYGFDPDAQQILGAPRRRAVRGLRPHRQRRPP